MLRRFIRYSCIYEARMSPTLNRISVIRHFEGSNAIEIRHGITFDFYTGLPHMHVQNYVCIVGQRGLFCTQHVSCHVLDKFRQSTFNKRVRIELMQE